MGKIKWSFWKYVPLCLILAYLGTYAIGIGSNNLQTWYEYTYSEIDFAPNETAYEIYTDEDGVIHYYFYNTNGFVTHSPYHKVMYFIISYAQMILIPLWVILCLAGASNAYYKRELEAPLKALFFASDQISKNCLDFQIEVKSKNELGKLCQSFEDMRIALYQNNQEMWRMLEERKRLNAAFSHDMRTPITVLKGYTDLLETYIPDGKISDEKLLEVLGMMSGQIARLESYTQKMSAVQKLEDVTPEPKTISWEAFLEKCRLTGELITGEKEIVYKSSADSQELWIDEEQVLEVYENLLSNAVRHAKNKVAVVIQKEEDKLTLAVADDGAGFSEAALKRAAEPFFREDKESKLHFGLGLYICKVLCEKNHGALLVENGESGGKVTAVFHVRQEKV